jgi:hypothetical protein
MVGMPIEFHRHWWIHLQVILNVRQLRFEFAIIPCDSFQFGFTLSIMFTEHYERYVLVHF